MQNNTHAYQTHADVATGVHDSKLRPTYLFPGLAVSAGGAGSSVGAGAVAIRPR